jgi:hypothetical protein
LHGAPTLRHREERSDEAIHVSADDALSGKQTISEGWMASLRSP